MLNLPLNQVICNNNLKVLKTLPDNCIDALITDPPAGISFMNLAFDSKRGGREQWIAWLREILEECKRVMKPGAIGFVWSLPRTQHWTALACEDAGFDIWDNLGVAAVTGNGMPKGTDIGQVIDRRNGAKRKMIGLYTEPNGRIRQKVQNSKARSVTLAQDKWTTRNKGVIGAYETAPATPDAQKWDGWKTPSLKPAMEMWVAIRKPFPGSCVDNVLEWGTGTINIADCRIDYDQGRYPANFILQHSPKCTDEQCHECCPVFQIADQGGYRVSGAKYPGGIRPNVVFQEDNKPRSGSWDRTEGTVDRYFHKFDPPAFHYQSKASPTDRNDGTKHLLWKRDKTSSIGWTACSPEEWEEIPERDRVAGNIHATVKSTQLMEFFVKLATPPGGVVLDPFAGSGSTAVACVRCGFDFIVIEQEPEYCRIAEARIDNATSRIIEAKQPTLEERVAWLETQQQATNAKLKRIERSQAIQLSLF